MTKYGETKSKTRNVRKIIRGKNFEVSETFEIEMLVWQSKKNLLLGLQGLKSRFYMLIQAVKQGRMRTSPCSSGAEPYRIMQPR